MFIAAGMNVKVLGITIKHYLITQILTLFFWFMLFSREFARERMSEWANERLSELANGRMSELENWLMGELEN